jgi:hypothetical protein
VPVAQPVVDQLDQLAGGGDGADVAAATGADPVPDGAGSPASKQLQRVKGR